MQAAECGLRIVSGTTDGHSSPTLKAESPQPKAHSTQRNTDLQTATLTQERLAELIDQFAQARIAVLGDFFLDKYMDVDPALEEISVETGKPAHQVSGVRCSPGAAGTVVCNLAALGAGQLHAIGIIGDDGEGYDLCKALHRLGCGTERLHISDERATPTYRKPRDVNVPGLSGEHSRYDTKNRATTPAHLEDIVVAALDELLPDVHAVAVMDQIEQPDCGVVTQRTREILADRAREHNKVVFFADSRRRIKEFKRLIIKPNQFETVGVDDPQPGAQVDLAELQSAGMTLRKENEAPVIITCGELGMVVSDPDWLRVPGIRSAGEIDPTGAGDSVTAGTVLALCAGATLPEAAVVGNLVASITVQQLATTGVARPEQLAGQLEQYG